MAPYELFFLFGDSLIQQSCDQSRGFALTPALQDAYIRKLDVVNRGFSGYNSSHALKVLPQILPSPEEAKIRIMAILFGANDSCLPGSDSGQQIPIENFHRNLVAIATHPIVRAQNPRIMLITPPPIDEAPREKEAAAQGRSGTRRTAERIKQYADEVREAGNDLHLPVVDLWSAFMKEAGWTEGQPLVGAKDQPQNAVLKELMRDGLHLTPRGYEVLYNQVMETIERVWPDQLPSQMPMVVPSWEQMPM